MQYIVSLTRYAYYILIFSKCLVGAKTMNSSVESDEKKALDKGHAGTYNAFLLAWAVCGLKLLGRAESFSPEGL